MVTSSDIAKMQKLFVRHPYMREATATYADLTYSTFAQISIRDLIEKLRTNL